MCLLLKKQWFSIAMLVYQRLSEPKKKRHPRWVPSVQLKQWPPKAMVASRQHTFIQGNLGHGCCQGVPAAVSVVSGFQNCRWDRDHCGFPYFLSGGNSKIVYVYPDPWGDGPIWRSYFSKGLKPTSISFFVCGKWLKHMVEQNVLFVFVQVGGDSITRNLKFEPTS